MIYFDSAKEAIEKLEMLHKEVDLFNDSRGYVNRVGVGFELSNGFFIEKVLDSGVPFKIRFGITRSPNKYTHGALFPAGKSSKEIDYSYLLRLSGVPNDIQFLRPGESFYPSKGTIGAIVYKYGVPHILSCRHCLGTVGQRLKRNTEQQDQDYLFASVSEVSDNLDCGLALIDKPVRGKIDARILELDIAPTDTAKVKLHNLVVKYGSSTGKSEGYVRLVNVITKDTSKYRFVEIQSTNGENFTDEGDSGSLVLLKKSPNIALALHFRKACHHTRNGSLSIPIEQVKTELNFKFKL